MAYQGQNSFSLGLSQTPETTDSKIFPELVRIYNALHIMQDALDAYTGHVPTPPQYYNQITPAQSLGSSGSNKLYCKANENIGAGHVVGFSNIAGEIQARKAGGGTGGKAQGICNVSGGVLAGQYGEFIFLSGLSQYIGGMTKGIVYYLSSTTPGLITSAAGTTPIGFALDSSLLFVQIALT